LTSAVWAAHRHVVDRHRTFLDALVKDVLEQPGSAAPALRQAASRNRDLPAELAAYVGKVESSAYQVTDEEVAALAAAGYSEDQIFEITVAAALGAAVRRLEAGLAPLAAPPAKAAAAKKVP
jgi:alkylhydroperoxidase family enzyme